MDVKSAAKALECSPSLIYALVSERRIRFYRVGRRGKKGKIVIPDDAIEAFREAAREDLADD